MSPLAAGFFGGGLSLLFSIFTIPAFYLDRDNKKLTEYKEKQDQALRERWVVSTETKDGFSYPDKDGKYTKDEHSAVVVSCTRKGSDDVRIGFYDSRKDDLREKVIELIAKAEDRCGDLNALEVKPRPGRSRDYSWH
jgi:hypothetical protein